MEKAPCVKRNIPDGVCFRSGMFFSLFQLNP